MTELVWYYARGDLEKGPLTTAQIKALAAGGKIRADDLVWKEGMPQWAPARDVAELFPTGKPPASANPAETQPVIEPHPLARDATSRSALTRPLGRSSLAIGMLVVLFSRSCDSLGQHHVERLNAELASQELQLADRLRRERSNLEAEIQSLQIITNRTPTQQQQWNQATQALTQIGARHDEERERLERDVLADLRTAAQAAAARQRIWGFWQQAAFLLGTVVLTFGLLTVSFTSDGPEKWICLTLLAAIVASIYLAGGW